MKRGYEDLEIFQLSKNLAIKVHRLTMVLPKFETYEEGSQIRRSSKSTVSNIVEGYCLRRHPNEFLQYLHRSFGSCEETRLHLQLLFETGSLRDEAIFKDLVLQYEKLGKMIFRFIETVMSGQLAPLYTKMTTKTKNR